MNHLECVTSKRNEWYWYLLVLFLCFLIANVVGAIPLVVIMIVSVMKEGFSSEILAGNFYAAGLDKNLVLFAMLFVFAVMLFAAVLLIKLIHGRSWQEVINGTKRMRWPRFFYGFVIFSILTLIGFAISFFTEPENFEFQFDPVRFSILLLVAVVFIPLQSVAEEFSFRGYLTQGVASWTKSRWWALIIPSVLFGLLHAFNPEVLEYGFWVMMPQYLFMGFMFGLMSLLDDGIELAMGVHTANNLFGCILVTFKGSALQTDALFSVKEMNPAADILPLMISGLLLLVIFGVTYKWKFNVMNQKVQLKETKEGTIAPINTME